MVWNLVKHKGNHEDIKGDWRYSSIHS